MRWISNDDADARFPGARKAWEEQMERELPGSTKEPDWLFKVKESGREGAEDLLFVDDGGDAPTFSWVWSGGQWIEFDDWFMGILDFAARTALGEGKDGT